MQERQRRTVDSRAASEVQRGDRSFGLVRSESASLNQALRHLRDDLHGILRQAVEAVEPGRLITGALARLAPLPDSSVVISAGKAAWPMYTALASAVSIERGLVTAALDVARVDRGRVEVFDAGHPSPNGASLAAGERALVLARESVSTGGLLVLLSGGASAMLVAPRVGLTLDDKVQTTRRVMAAGGAIHELNCVRKHLSRIKGGQLAKAAGRTITFALSDVHAPVADDPSIIGSGPTVPDESTFADALDVISQRDVEVPAAVRDYLERGARGEAEETIKPGDPSIAESSYTIIGNRHTAVNGARQAAEQRGYHVITFDDATTGEARIAALDFVSRARRFSITEARPLCVIGSGETTVTVRGDGVGGRNQEFALAAISQLGAFGNAVVLASAGTDGIDGPTRAAGALVDAASLTRASRLGVDWESALARNDSYRFFDALGDLIFWGPTGTNVGDLHVMLIGRSDGDEPGGE